MKKIICWIRGIPFFIKTGIWCPHVYEEVYRDKGIIISTQNSFRFSSNLQHNQYEEVHPNSTVIHYKCVCCGCEDISWYDKEPFVIKD